jgi:hypothetical protein
MKRQALFTSSGRFFPLPILVGVAVSYWSAHSPVSPWLPIGPLTALFPPGFLLVRSQPCFPQVSYWSTHCPVSCRLTVD